MLLLALHQPKQLLERLGDVGCWLKKAACGHAASDLIAALKLVPCNVQLVYCMSALFGLAVQCFLGKSTHRCGGHTEYREYM